MPTLRTTSRSLSTRPVSFFSVLWHNPVIPNNMSLLRCHIYLCLTPQNHFSWKGQKISLQSLLILSDSAQGSVLRYLTLYLCDAEVSNNPGGFWSALHWTYIFCSIHNVVMVKLPICLLVYVTGPRRHCSCYFLL